MEEHEVQAELDAIYEEELTALGEAPDRTAVVVALDMAIQRAFEVGFAAAAASQRA